MELGFIGLGSMGRAMVRRLLAAGHRVTVYNRTPSKAADLVRDGAILAESPDDACRGEVVITMLADDAAVEATLFENGRIRHGFGRETIHVAMSTISAALSERLTEAHREAGQSFVAAPVFGRPDAAAAGKLFVVAAGPGPAVERCQPLFEAMAQRTFIIGPRPVSANIVKLSGNFLIASMLESLGEAFALVRKSGIDPERYLEILVGSLFNAPIYQMYGSMIAAERHDPPGFKLRLGLKDVRLALAAAERAEVPMPVASLVHNRLLTGLAQGEGDRDWSALAQLAARSAGL
jgi:3-hydroxyisobutyrate dehydrogenase-like beta-hydroxyacid dehydrogenase